MKSCHGVHRTRWLNSVGTVALVLTLAAAMPEQAFADDESAISQEELRELAAAIKLQQQKLAAQERALAEQQRTIAEQQNQLNFLKTQVGSPLETHFESAGAGSITPVVYNLGQAGSPGSPRTGIFKAQDSQEQQQQPVGQAPVEQRPEVSIIPERGGVLTRQGQLVLEPQLEYAQSNVNRFFFQGFEFVDAVLIGLIEATDAERETLQAALGARVGVTNRLELEVRVPYLYRDDSVENTAFVSGTPQELPAQSATGAGLGDIEVAGHYQINDGLGGWPYFIGNLRVKTNTGTSPFEVDFDSEGVAQDLATGSGFWAVQPSVTTIFPSDPAVFFGNLGYTWNIERDVNETIAETHIGNVDPGDSVNTTFGMGISLNERTSFSFGFEYNYVFETEQESNGVTAESDKLKVGSLLLGWSYQLTDDVGLNLNTAFGVTEDATDFRTTLRVPIRFDLF